MLTTYTTVVMLAKVQAMRSQRFVLLQGMKDGSYDRVDASELSDRFLLELNSRINDNVLDSHSRNDIMQHDTVIRASNLGGTDGVGDSRAERRLGFDNLHTTSNDGSKVLTVDDEHLLRTLQLKETLMKNGNYRAYVVQKALKQCKQHLEQSETLNV